MNKVRRYLLIGSGAVVAAGLGALGVAPMVSRSMIAKEVRKRLSFLKLDEAGLEAFAKDQVAYYIAKRPTWNRIQYHFMSVFSESFTKYNMSNDHRTRTERLVDNFCANYLISSDYFLGGSDNNRVVKYLGFYDPMRPCGNPFARPVLAPGAPA